MRKSSSRIRADSIVDEQRDAAVSEYSYGRTQTHTQTIQQGFFNLWAARWSKAREFQNGESQSKGVIWSAIDRS